MSQKKSQAEQPQYIRKSSATVIAVACLFAGVFIGLNLSLFTGGGAGKSQPVVSIAPPSQPVGEASPPSFDFAALTKAAEANPANAAGWIKLGHAYFDTDKYAQAITVYEKALAIDANNADVWVDLGVMYRRNGQPQKAVECFSRASVVDPRHETARFNQGIVLLHDLNDRAGAIGTWEVLLKINPEAQTPSGKHLHDLIDEVKAGG